MSMIPAAGGKSGGFGFGSLAGWIGAVLVLTAALLALSALQTTNGRRRSWSRPPGQFTVTGTLAMRGSPFRTFRA